MVGALSWYMAWDNLRDRKSEALSSDDEARTAIIYTRLDLKLVAQLVGGVLVMLGIIADRMH
jgi:F0F1-type ATP synthase assembly protein I